METGNASAFQMFSVKKLIIVLFIALPSALALWLANIFINRLFAIEVVNLSRWLGATLMPIVFIVWGLRRNSLSISGAIAGFFVGFIITLSNYAFLGCLIMFFVSSSKATKFRSHMKEKFEENFHEAGRRNWIQVFCNGAIPSIVALFYILDCGCREMTLDLVTNYRCSWLSYSFLGAMCCCNGDTWASELGPVFNFGEPYLIINLKPVPKGTNGGVSLAGLIASFLGGSVVGLGFWIALHLFVPSSILIVAPSQWPVIIYGGIAGFLGSLIDSILGSTMQYSGIDQFGRVIELPGPKIQYICGRKVLDNNAVNLISCLLMALLMPYVAIFSS